MTAIFHWERVGDKLPKFERRVTICSAADKKAATKTLLREARAYPSSEDMIFLSDYIIEEFDGPPGKAPIEVASELTIGVDPKTGTIIKPDQFLEEHWDVRKLESCDTLGFQHVWCNKDGLTSGCYNCGVVREGRLWEHDPAAKEAVKPATS
jgi:hypothetical protein